jgi:hypothetical protein
MSAQNGTPPANGAMTMRQMATLLGAIGAIATMHTVVLVPLMRSSVAADITDAVEAHRSRQTHPDTASRREIDSLLGEIRKDDADRRAFRAEMRDRLGRLERRMGER